jgi:hypothetical protein
MPSPKSEKTKFTVAGGAIAALAWKCQINDCDVPLWIVVRAGTLEALHEASVMG